MVWTSHWLVCPGHYKFRRYALAQQNLELSHNLPKTIYHISLHILSLRIYSIFYLKDIPNNLNKTLSMWLVSGGGRSMQLQQGLQSEKQLKPKLQAFPHNPTQIHLKMCALIDSFLDTSQFPRLGSKSFCSFTATGACGSSGCFCPKAWWMACRGGAGVKNDLCFYGCFIFQ